MKTILVPLDFSDAAPPVLETAMMMARSFSARLVLIHVAAPEPAFIGYEPGPQTVRDVVARELTSEHRKLQALEKSVREHGLDTTALLMQGYPVEKIVQESEKIAADLIIMGSHGHGALRHLLVGSVTEGVMRHVHCPVVVVPHHK